MPKTIDFITDSKKRFRGEMIETIRGLAIKCSDLPIPEDGESVYLKLEKKTYSFQITETDIDDQHFFVRLKRSSMMTRNDDPFADENIDLSQELGG